VRSARRFDGVGYAYEVLDVLGRNPLGDQSPARFAGAEAANRFPHRSKNAYPHGYEQVAQFFEAPMAPDLCVVHSAAHNHGKRGSNCRCDRL
jgi:phosphonoacetate hydrolase